MQGMGVAVERLRRAIAHSERVRIVTDYDVDGTTSSLILQRTLWLLGAEPQVEYHIPDRFDEGYGFSLRAARRAAQDGIDALDSAADLLDRYGGHPTAAGFSIAADRLPALAERLDAWAREHAEDDLAPILELDAACRPTDVDQELVEALDRIGPYGKGNPRPLLRVDSVVPSELRVLCGRHLRFQVGPVEALWWNAARFADHFRGDRTLALAAAPEIHRWRGRETVRLIVEDARLEDDA